MAFIEDLLERLFPKKKLNFSMKENFVQSEMEIEALQRWMLSGEGKDFFEKIYRNYHLKKAGIQDKPEVHILSSPYANGFALSFQQPFSEDSFSKFFFALGQRVLDLGYEKVSLDRKVQEVHDWIKTTEKQYFKAPFGSASDGRKIDQLYGNVSIEKELINDKSSYIKVLATIYSDHLYHRAKPFDQFVEKIFEFN